MRILIVDDDPATVAFMQLAFESDGMAVQTATGVEEALRSALADTPDVVLSDLTFRGEGDDTSDGFALVKQLRDRPETAHIGVLAVSGADHPDVLRAAKAQGFDGFVAKPVDVASLISHVNRLGESVAHRHAEARGVDSP